MTRFQTIFFGVLIFLGVTGAALFALARNKPSPNAVPLTMWGTVESKAVVALLGDLSQGKDGMNISYIEKEDDEFESDLIAALARGEGPDMVLLPQDLILKQRDKFYVVPFENFSARAFKDSFIGEGELYLTSAGVMGFPFSVDPLVMYWNRDMFADNGLPKPPTTWTEILDLAPKFAKKDDRGNITQSLVAFGEVRNVSHAKDIVSLLILQAGSPIVSYSGQGDLSSVFDKRNENGLVPSEQALGFYTEFSNPGKPTYSWNRALPSDRTLFLGGKLGLYFGYASELLALREGNPNLNFDVALVPQAGSKKQTFGRMNAIALLKASPNLSAAYVAAVTLTNQEYHKKWIELSGLPPVRRDLLTQVPTDPYKAVFYQSALTANAWLDPYREATDGIFMRLVEDVTSGKYRVSESVAQASDDLANLLRALR
jgi:ABC-type glycerol-3-phosphate transport system substrate-binding protein